MAHQIRHEDKAALQHTDKQRRAACNIARDLRADLRDALLQLLLREQNFGNVRMQLLILHVFLSPSSQ